MRSKFNKFIYRFKYNYGQHLNLKRPVDVSLELSSICNMRCGYCYHADQKNLPFDKGQMDLVTANKIIFSAAEHGVNSLKFNWKGESTLNKHYSVITSYARDLRRGSTFIELLANSNFQFKASDEIFRGLANLTKVKISYDSFQSHVFENQRIGGKHREITYNIDSFYNHHMRIKNDTEIVIQAVRTDANANEDLEYMIKKRWPSATASIRDMVSGRNESTTEGFKSVTSLKRKPCKQAFARLIFNWKGEAYACCPDIKEQIKLGSIHQGSVKEIFNGARATGLRKRLVNGKAFKSDPCKSCSSYETFEGYNPNWGS